MPTRFLKEAPLGQKCAYDSEYDPDLLFPIPREWNRKEMGITGELPFHGVDVWTAFELSWLNPKGKPEIAMGEFFFPCTSPNIIESKSLKLYLNALNQTKFESIQKVHETLQRDLSAASGADATVQLVIPEEFAEIKLTSPSDVCIDELDVTIDTYEVCPELLQLVSDEVVQEKLYSNLLKSNCLKTGQPDWATVFISYEGSKIDRASLLQYIVSHRMHQGFHEDTVEKIYIDILGKCAPKKLTVFARYTRRGGLDINSFRSNWESEPTNSRLARQ